MPHIIPNQSPGVILALAFLAAVALAALVLALLEHRRVATLAEWVEGLDDELGDLIGTVHRHGVRLEAHALIQHELVNAICGDAPPVRPALELIEGGCPDTPAALAPVAAESHRVALSVVAR